MILLVGIPSEPPLLAVARAAEARGEQVVLLNQRRFEETEINFEIADDGIRGNLHYEGMDYSLEGFSGIYHRLMEERFLPELESESPDSSVVHACRAVHEALVQWIDIAPGRVVNRLGSMQSNSSKPFQSEQIRACGLQVPESLITNDPQQVLDFQREHQDVIYKSMSGTRSIVQRLAEDDLDRLEDIRWCPTLFQAQVPGSDVRVHVVGQTVFATAVGSRAIDYRYSEEEGLQPARLSKMQLPREWEQRCVDLCQELGLAFGGIDLRVTPGRDVYCFEVNTLPGYSYYEIHTGQPISTALAAYLAGGDPMPGA